MNIFRTSYVVGFFAPSLKNSFKSEFPLALPHHLISCVGVPPPLCVVRHNRPPLSAPLLTFRRGGAAFWWDMQRDSFVGSVAPAPILPSLSTSRALSYLFPLGSSGIEDGSARLRADV